MFYASFSSTLSLVHIHTLSGSSLYLPLLPEDCSIVLPTAPEAVHPPTAGGEESEPAMPAGTSPLDPGPTAEGSCPASEQDECECIAQSQTQMAAIECIQQTQHPVECAHVVLMLCKQCPSLYTGGASVGALICYFILMVCQSLLY